MTVGRLTLPHNARGRRRARYLHTRHTDVRVASCPLCDADAAATAAAVDDQLRRLGHPTARRRTR